MGSIALGGIVAYIKTKNSIFLAHPTYLPSQINDRSLDAVGPGDLNPIIDFKEYFYNCKNESSLGLMINQYRVKKPLLANKDILDPHRGYPLNSGTYFHPPQGTTNIKVNPEDFTLINSQQVNHNNKTYLFKEYSSSKIPETVFELLWQDNRVGVLVETTSSCLSKAISLEELTKIVDSMH